MVVVRLPPDARRRHHEDAERIEDRPRQTRAAQERPVHVIVVEDELAHGDEAGQHGDRNAQRPGQSLPAERVQAGHDERRAEQIPPATQPGLRHERFGRFDQITAGAQPKPPKLARASYQISVRNATYSLTSCTMTHYTGRA